MYELGGGGDTSPRDAEHLLGASPAGPGHHQNTGLKCISFKGLTAGLPLASH